MMSTKKIFTEERFIELLQKPLGKIKASTQGDYGHALAYRETNGIDFEHISKGRAGVYYSALMYLSRSLLQNKGLKALEFLFEEIYPDLKKLHAIKQTTRVNSKRRALSKLPPDWQEQMWAASQGHEHRAIIAILTLAGNRPGILIDGVTIKASTKKLALIFKGNKKYKGNKALAQNDPDMRVLSADRGQDEYALVFDRSTDEIADWLAEHYSGQKLDWKRWIYRKTLTSIQKKANMGVDKRGNIKKASKITPNVYRHQNCDVVSSKAGELGLIGDDSDIFIAKAMGHRSTSSQSSYGVKNRKSSGRKSGLIKVVTSNDVRVVKNQFSKDRVVKVLRPQKLKIK